ncbi:hypothetical protein CQW23_29896 [Capsicum baccatum]|uniref:P-type Cu(+) transporter n=1 Tax=Capsicum baccatum TaxID=33114 RepID=A0A2G2VC53_CAPBA|nr:hypothetical protein CQW23_29896 [Capsicum baccatum]
MVVNKIWICEKTEKEQRLLGISRGKKSILGTPTESEILEYGLLLGGDIDKKRRDCILLKVEPFNSEKKNMSVLIALPDGTTELFARVQLRYSLKCVTDPVCPGVKNAVKTCLAAGITVRMVTGDNIKTAKTIAKECGILTTDGLAIHGPEFLNKTPDEMRHIIPRVQLVLVNNLRGMFKEIVAVTGDGTDDAPALHEADIRFAIGIAGAEVCKLLLSYVNLLFSRITTYR